MYCVNCGKKVEPGERFCSECGKPVKEAEVIKKAFSPTALKSIIILGVVLVAIIALVAVLSNIRTSGGSMAADCRKVIENLLAYGDLENTVRVVSLTVTNSFEQEMLGSVVRSVEFEVELEYLGDIGQYYDYEGEWLGWESVPDKNYESAALNSFARLRLPMLEAGPSGEKKNLNGEIDFEKTSKGWLGPDGEFY